MVQKVVDNKPRVKDDPVSYLHQIGDLAIPIDGMKEFFSFRRMRTATRSLSRKFSSRSGPRDRKWRACIRQWRLCLEMFPGCRRPCVFLGSLRPGGQVLRMVIKGPRGLDHPYRSDLVGLQEQRISSRIFFKDVQLYLECTMIMLSLSLSF